MAGEQLKANKGRKLSSFAASNAKRQKGNRSEQGHGAAGDSPSDPVVPDSPFNGKHVRIVQDDGLYDRDVGRQGIVQEVRVASNGVERALILTDGDAVAYVSASLQCVVLTSTDAEKTPPAPAALDYRSFPVEQRATWQAELNVTAALDNLEIIALGQLVELQTIAAGLLEMAARLSGADVYILTPAETTSFTDASNEGDMQEGQLAQYQVILARVRSKLDECRLVLAAIHQPGHYTALAARRPTLEDGWTVIQSDSLPPSLDTVLYGQRVTEKLGLPQPTLREPQPRQRDGWSCGLWALRFVEEQWRQHRNEPLQLYPSPLGVVRARVDRSVSFVRGTAPIAAAAGEPSYDGKIVRRGAAEMPNYEPLSLAEALERAKACPCVARKSDGFKGCSKTTCMGHWFELYRLKRRR